jgi:hydroxymethylpyrimidine/phosphomethylpyrimidine kinase
MVFSALTIAGSDSGGGAGIQADLKTFAAHRVHGLIVLTSLTAQNTFSVANVSDVPIDFIESQFEADHDDFKVGAAKTGMLGNKEIIKTVARNVGSYLLVVDPVMVSESGGKLLLDDAIETLKTELLPKAILVTPNIFEAEILSGLKITNIEKMKMGCKRISEFGCNVVIKGGHLNAIDVLYADKKFHIFQGTLLDGSFHGSGCTYSASITANLALGFDLETSIKNAKAFIKGTLETSYSPGKGEMRVVNQMRMTYEDRFDEVLLALKSSVLELETLNGLYIITPEVGMNLCFAKKDASSLADVAGITGRVLRVGDKVRALGSVEYGASKHMGRVVLAAMSFDANIRAAVNLKYRANTIEVIKRTGKFVISSFDRKNEPLDKSTMEWGTLQAVQKKGMVPDIVYDKGDVGKEPMIRVLGKDPSDVILKVKRILEAADGV